MSLTFHDVMFSVFRAMFFGGMRETHGAEVELHGTPLEAFRVLLKYIYYGRIRFNNLRLDLILDIFALVHQYDFRKLEDALCEFLKNALLATNVAVIYAAAHLFSKTDLVEACLDFMDRSATAVLRTEVSAGRLFFQLI